jgi:predicted phage terminase large subunit-like protein
VLIIMTRWHVDDLLGRFIAKFGDEVRVLRYPAIAEKDETHFYQGKPVHRHEGDALFPELKPIDFLLERKKLETQASFESLFQQHPIIVGGGQLPIDNLRALNFFDRNDVAASVRYWDKAATDTSETAAFTAGVLMHKSKDGRFIIEHVVRGRWNALDRERQIKAWTETDTQVCKSYEAWVEQEPGSGGKESAEATIRLLAGYRAYADKVTGSKQNRAQPFAAQVQGGNMWLVAGPWVAAFLEECESWPHGKYADQIDAAAGAFNKLTTSSYNLNYREWAY